MDKRLERARLFWNRSANSHTGPRHAKGRSSGRDPPVSGYYRRRVSCGGPFRPGAQSRGNILTSTKRKKARRLKHGVLRLNKFYRRDRPPAIVTFDRNTEPVEFIKPNLFHCPCRAIGQYNRFANKLALCPLEIGENCGRVSFCIGHRVFGVSVR